VLGQYTDIANDVVAETSMGDWSTLVLTFHATIRLTCGEYLCDPSRDLSFIIAELKRRDFLNADATLPPMHLLRCSYIFHTVESLPTTEKELGGLIESLTEQWLPRFQF
jgi:hypothetical protein